jgi:uncharacterized lipoprotein YmbA
MKSFLLCCFLMVMVSCGHMPESRYYTIDYSAPVNSTAAGRGVLFVQAFTADELYAQDMLVYKDSAYEVKFDHYRRWITPPADMLTQKAVEHFRSLAIFERVTIFPPRTNQYLTLSSRVNKFEEIDGPANQTAKVALWVEVENSEKHDILWSGSLAAEQSIAEKTPDGIVRAMSEATRKVFDQLGEKLKQIQ